MEEDCWVPAFRDSVRQTFYLILAKDFLLQESCEDDSLALDECSSFEDSLDHCRVRKLILGFQLRIVKIFDVFVHHTSLLNRCEIFAVELDVTGAIQFDFIFSIVNKGDLKLVLLSAKLIKIITATRLEALEEKEDVVGV